MPPVKAKGAAAIKAGSQPSNRGGEPAGLPPKKQSQEAAPSMAAPSIPSKQLTAKEREELTQLKTYTRWWHATLQQARNAEHTVTDLSKDLATGIVPVALMEVLTRAEIKHNKEPKNRIKQMENIAIFIRQLKTLGIPSANMSAEDLADGKKHLMLTLTWNLIVHFAPSSNEAALADDQLRWMQSNTKGYVRVDVSVWAGLCDGRALCAILHRYDPSALDFDALPDADAEGAALASMEIAFETAERKFGAPRLLEAADVALALDPSMKLLAADATSAADGAPELRSMITYLLSLRQALRQHRDARAKEVAGRCAAFVSDAEALGAWVLDATQIQLDRTVIAHRFDRTSKEDVADADRMLSQLEDDFRGTEKVAQQKKRSELAQLRLPAISRTLVENEEADKRFKHRMPGEKESAPAPGAPLSAVERGAAANAESPAFVVESAAAAIAKLDSTLRTLDTAWAKLEAAEEGLSVALWLVLVEKKTDLMVKEVLVEAKKLEDLAIGWAEKMESERELPVLKFDDRKETERVWPPEAGDSAAALAQGVHVLELWTATGTDDCASALDDRRSACVALMNEASRRRSEEGRPLAAVQAAAPHGGRSSPLLQMEDVLHIEHKLEVAWLEMNEAAAELQTKLHEMLKWQRTQLESTSTRLGSAHKKLGKLRPEMVKQSWFGAPEPTRAPPPATPGEQSPPKLGGKPSGKAEPNPSSAGPGIKGDGSVVETKVKVTVQEVQEEKGCAIL